jgi:NAD-dependent SIR2 family protein deacetylase
MGVDSGLPDFRGNEGLWRAYPALGVARIGFESMANPALFHDDPTLAWGFYGHRLKLYREIEPHVGFAILQRWGERMARGAFSTREPQIDPVKGVGILGGALATLVALDQALDART